MKPGYQDSSEKKHPLVSVIIPVYKTAQTLPSCLESVFSQEYPALEVLLVDDGSPDDSGALCDRFAAEHANVFSFHQENRGLGEARNTGMANCHGDYLIFLDSDDKLDGEKAIQRLVSKAEETHADITAGAFRRFDDTTESGVNDHHLSGLDSTSALFRFRGFYQYGHLAYSWGKLYRVSFLKENELWQKPYPFTQDKAHNLMCYALKPRYAFLSESVALYRVNPASVTFRYKKDLLPVWIRIASDYANFLKEREIKEDYSDLLSLHVFFGSFFMMKQELDREKGGIRAAAQVLKALRSYPLAKDLMHRLAFGKDARGIDALSWKLLVKVGSFFFCCHFDYLMAFGVFLLRRMKVDRKITERRYRKNR